MVYLLNELEDDFERSLKTKSFDLPSCDDDHKHDSPSSLWEKWSSSQFKINLLGASQVWKLQNDFCAAVAACQTIPQLNTVMFYLGRSFFERMQRFVGALFFFLCLPDYPGTQLDRPGRMGFDVLPASVCTAARLVMFVEYFFEWIHPQFAPDILLAAMTSRDGSAWRALLAYQPFRARTTRLHALHRFVMACVDSESDSQRTEKAERESKIILALISPKGKPRRGEQSDLTTLHSTVSTNRNSGADGSEVLSKDDCESLSMDDCEAIFNESSSKIEKKFAEFRSNFEMEELTLHQDSPILQSFQCAIYFDRYDEYLNNVGESCFLKALVVCKLERALDTLLGTTQV